MANEKFKLYITDGETTKVITENHPKLNATTADFGNAGDALNTMYGLPLDRVDLQSDTTVYTAE